MPKKGTDIFSNFINQTLKAIDFLIEEKLAIPSKFALMGLSRGAFIALRVAAKCPKINWLLAFSPLIDLSDIDEFNSLKDTALLQSLHSDNIIDSLIDKEIRFYIGNNDTRVGTKNSYSFIEKIALQSFLKRRKNARAELIIYPSIGYKGHGTDKNTFKEGCLWLKQKLI